VNILNYACNCSLLTVVQRLGAVINTFRERSLGLEPLSVRSGPGIVDRLKVPWTYSFSPALVPKPLDWKNYIGM
jgi:sterol 3beta-glucosyltransferase